MSIEEKQKRWSLDYSNGMLACEIIYFAYEPLLCRAKFWDRQGRIDWERYLINNIPEGEGIGYEH